MDTKREIFMREAYQKLDSLPVAFGMPKYSNDLTYEQILGYIGIATKSAMREFELDENSIENLDEWSETAEKFTNRIVYHKIRSFRLTSAGFYKFSTSTDGRTIDKTKINDYLTKLMKDLDEEYRKSKLLNCFNRADFGEPNFNYAWRGSGDQ